MTARYGLTPKHYTLSPSPWELCPGIVYLPHRPDPTPMCPDRYDYWRRVARRHAVDEQVAGDLLHDAILAAGALPPADGGEAARLFVGVLRNLARQGQRADARRARRETVFAAAPTADRTSHEPANPPPTGAAAPLAEAQRTLLALLATDYDRDEIAAALGLGDPALRQRIATLRRRLRVLPQGHREQVVAHAAGRLAERRTLGDPLQRARAIALARDRGALCTIDPDGHPVALGRISTPTHHVPLIGDHKEENRYR